MNFHANEIMFDATQLVRIYFDDDGDVVFAKVGWIAQNEARGKLLLFFWMIACFVHSRLILRACTPISMHISQNLVAASFDAQKVHIPRYIFRSNLHSQHSINIYLFFSLFAC